MPGSRTGSPARFGAFAGCGSDSCSDVCLNLVGADIPQDQRTPECLAPSLETVHRVLEARRHHRCKTSEHICLVWKAVSRGGCVAGVDYCVVVLSGCCSGLCGSR